MTGETFMKHYNFFLILITVEEKKDAHVKALI